MANLKEQYIDWILEEQSKGNIFGVKWVSDEKGVHFKFSMCPEMIKNGGRVNPTYRNIDDHHDDDDSYAIYA